MSHPRVNPKHRLEDQGITGLGAVHYNLLEPALIEAAIARGEGHLGLGGAFLVSTGDKTGRSPRDKHVVRTDAVKDQIWWEANRPQEPEAFDRLYQDMLAHMKGRDYFVQDLYGGADPAHRLDVRLVTELAWHGLFIRHLLRRPAAEELAGFVPEFTIINCPSFKADPERHGVRSDTVVSINFDRKLILIGNTEYAGENKKSVFTLLNYILPERGVMPMHCSANHAHGDTDDVAIFFGLSGTGKTTLSADVSRTLLGDDEHGWSDDGVFNFEGGCYAKTINLSPEHEPEIYATTSRFGTVIENMVHDPDTLELDFADSSLTENMRAAYPLEAISNASATGMGGQPKNVIMLTCDAYGVLPPIARLTPAQAEYHFLSGFTSKTPGTEVGVTEPIPTFSTCFGAPFMPLHPQVYGKLLREKIAGTGATCWLVNTGWSGGGYGVGTRIELRYTRALIRAALAGKLDHVEYITDPIFGLQFPTFAPDVPTLILNPRSTWDNAKAYDKTAQQLAAMFMENFTRFAQDVSPAVLAAGPKVTP